MQNLEIPMNGWAVLGAAVSRFVVGGLWYSPMLFLKRWQKAAGVNDKQMKAGMPKAMAVDAVGSLILAFALLHAIKYAIHDSHELSAGLFVSFWNWLGLTAVIQIGSWTYERKPFSYFLINSGYNLVSILVAGAILTLWG